MSKRTKLNLEELKVQSSVILLDDEKSKLRGGDPPPPKMIVGSVYDVDEPEMIVE